MNRVFIRESITSGALVGLLSFGDWHVHGGFSLLVSAIAGLLSWAGAAVLFLNSFRLAGHR
ncbi:MAG: hypothetical protein A3E28_03395 [Candidatus Doudnabacteria bacterium RIFCSPHIGHO2_12_FULL_42_22]|nr:MAG: hypothetical protein A3E28_03395 [Candidatus Doudnabacteria bacterium RIFCSPHIGHO2_12_FULL_42_22]